MRLTSGMKKGVVKRDEEVEKLKNRMSSGMEGEKRK